jgi:GTP pyrophosphokinase
VYVAEQLHKPEEVIAKAFGPTYAELALETSRLIRVQRQARAAAADSQMAAVQTENVRKMLLAFSRDLRVVLLRLASRLQTLRYYAASKQVPSYILAHESLHVFAPLANRLGIWQIKWEMEDLAFRFLEPQTYKEIAKLLDEKRIERENYMAQLRERPRRACTGRWTAQTYLQHCQKNARQVLGLFAGV